MTLLARANSESYRVGLARARFMSVTTIRIEPGRVPDWVDYLIFTPRRSLKEIDEGNAKAEERMKAINAAVGGDEVAKQRRMLISEIVVESNTNHYAMSPTISRPSPQFAAADPDFWTPRPKAAPAKALAVKKESPKP